MNSKTLVAGLLTGIVSFLLGWLIFGLLLMNYYSSLMTQYDGLLKQEPSIWAILVANLASGLFMAYVFQLGNIRTPFRGFVTGMILSFLITLMFDLYLYAQFNLYSGSLVVLDVVATSIFGGVIGAFLGWWFGRSAKPTAG
jgi:hypothetical protein